MAGGAGGKVDIVLALKDAFSDGIRTATAALNGMGSVADKVLGSVFNLKTGLTGLAAGAVLNTFADFDDQMRAVGAVSGATGAQFQQLGDFAQEMGVKTRYSASQSAEAMYFMAQGGLSVQQIMAALPSVLNMAAAGNMDLATATDIAINAMSSYGMAAEDLPRIADILTTGANSATASVSDLGEAFKYVAPIAKGIGIEMTGLVAPMAMLHNSGIKASMAGTALRGAIEALMNPTAEEARLLSDLSARIGGAGLQIKDSSGKFVGFTAIVAQLEKAGLTADEALKLFGMRAGPGMQALVGQGSAALAEMEGKLRDFSGTTKKVAEQMEAGLGGAIREVKSAFEGAQTVFGKGFDAAATDTVRFLRDELRLLIERLKQLKADDTLDEWGKRIGDAVRDTVGYIKTFVAAAASVADSPFGKTLLSWTPHIVAAAVAVKTLTVALGIYRAAVAAATVAMSIGSWAVYLKHVQTASTYTNLLTVATASLGNALTVAAAAVGAFFAGWQIGELLEASDAFGLLPMTIGEYVQVAFAKIDEYATRVKIALLEVRAAWNDATGDEEESAAIRASIDAENQHLEAIKLTIAGITEKTTATTGQVAAVTEAGAAVVAAEQATAAQRVQVATDAASAIRRVELDKATAYLESIKGQSAALAQEYQLRTAQVETAEAQGLQTHQQANSAKLTLDAKYYGDALQRAEAGLQQVASVYGKDTDQYKQALQQKQKAAIDWLNHEKNVADQLKAIDKQVTDARAQGSKILSGLRKQESDGILGYMGEVSKISQTISEANNLAATDTEAAIAKYKEAMDAASGIVGEVTDAGKVTVTQQESAAQAANLVERAMNGIEQAAEAQKKAISDSMNTAQQESGDTRTEVQKLQDDLKDLGIDPVKISVDAEEGHKEIERVSAELEGLKQRTVVVDADTSALNSKLVEVEKRFKALASTMKDDSPSMNVEITGEASPVRPFTETMNRVSGMLEDFKSQAAEGGHLNVVITGDVGHGEEEFTAASQSIIDEYGALKSDIERQRIMGTLTFDGEMGSLTQSVGIVKAQYATLYADLQRGVNQYGATFGTAMRSVMDASASAGTQVDADSAGMAVDLSTLGTSATAFGQQFQAAIVAGNMDAFGTLAGGLDQYGAQFSDAMAQQIEAARQMADSVIADGERMIQALAGQISGIDQQLAAIEASMLSVSQSTEEQLYNLQKKQMTDHEQWLADKARAEEMYTAATAALQAGQFDEAKRLMLESQQIAGQLARDVRDESGEIISTAAENTTAAMEMVSQAGEGAQQVLAAQRTELEAQREEAQAQMEQVAAMVDSVSTLATGMGDTMTATLDQFTALMEQMMADLTTTIEEAITSSMVVVRSAVEEPMTPQVDTTPAQMALAELADEAKRHAADMYKQMEVLGKEQNQYSRTLYAGVAKEYEKAKRQWSEYQAEVSRGVKSTTTLTGKASPERPLTDTLLSVIDLFRQFRDEANSGNEAHVDFTGTGSPTKPLSEKIRDMGSALINWAANVPSAALDLDTSAVTGGIGAALDAATATLSPTLSVTGAARASGPDLKDYGRITLATPSGSAAEVMGPGLTLQGLAQALRREGLVTR